MIKEELDSGTPRTSFLSTSLAAISYGFIWRRGRTLSPAAQSFIKIVRAIEAKLGHDRRS